MGLKAFFHKNLSPGGRAVLHILLLAGFVALVNLLASFTQFRWDLSEGRVHTLGETTRHVLSQLDEPVRIVLVAQGPQPEAERLLQTFRNAGPSIGFETLDPAKNPERAASYGVDRNEFVIVESGAARRWIPRLREQSLLSAILQVAKGGDKKVLFTRGHGERALDGGEDSLARAKTLLQEAGYAVEQSEVTEDAVRDAAVIVIASPKEELSEQARRLVLSRMAEGAGVLVLLDPDSAGLRELVGAARVQPTREQIVELNMQWRAQGHGEHTLYPPYFHAGEHPIVMRATPRFRPFFANARALALEQADDSDRTPVPLATSSPQSRGQFRTGDGAVAWGAPRPWVVMAATHDSLSEAGAGRMVVSGTSSFATNRLFDTAGNRELWELAVSWLAGDLDTPLLAHKEPHKTFGFTGPNDPRLTTVLVVCVLVLPGLAALSGLFVFIKRTG